MIEDRRNLKCLFGMHQYEQFGKTETSRRFLRSSDELPISIDQTIVMKCEFCGKIKNHRINIL